MSQTVSAEEKYGWKGLRYNVLTSLVLMALGGWLSFLFAPEEIRCERQWNQAMSCELRRVVLGVPVWQRRLDGLREAKVRNADDVRSRNWQGGQVISQLWIRLTGNNTELDTGSGQDAVEVHGVAEALNAMLNDPAQTQTQLRIGGTPRFYPWTVGGFLLGASILPLWLLGLLVYRLRRAAAA
jgi:hypothetical protein